MSRNGSGTYNLPPLNPVVSGTTISSVWANNTFNDMGAEITNSLPRDGQAGMTAPLKLVDGTVLSPAFTFGSEINSGLYRAGTNDIRVTIQGSSVVAFTPTGISAAIGATTPSTGAFTTLAANGAATLGSTLAVTGTSTLTGAVTASSTLAVTGNTTIGGTLGVTGASTLAALSATNITASGTLGVTGATTLTTLSGTSATFSSTVTASSFSGAGTGLTGTASSLSIGGVAAQATRGQTNVQFVTGRIAASTDNTATSSLMVENNSGTGDTNLAAISFHCVSQYGIKLHLRGDGYFGLGGWSSPAWRWYSDPSGNMTASGDITAYSDPRLKKNVKRIEGALDKLESLDGVNFTWKNKKGLGKAGKADVGVLADQVKAVMPEAVHTSGIEIAGKKYDMVAYDKLIPLLIEAVKELRAEVKSLRGE